MRSRRFVQCDVFSPVPTKGNALAVVVDGAGLSTEAMQAFAQWTNLAETTFILPPTTTQADYQLRIFTPGWEMPFAGHPTLGSCMAWLKAGGVPKQSGQVRQECAIGIVEIDVTGEVPAFTAPPTAIQPMDAAEAQQMVAALGLKPEQVRQSAVLTNGPVWHVFELASAAAVLAIEAQPIAWHAFRSVGLIGPHAPETDCDYETRCLDFSGPDQTAPAGLIEDPVTGSLNAALACWLAAQHRLEHAITIAQGTRLGRRGRLHIAPGAPRPTVGGEVHILIEGTVFL